MEQQTNNNEQSNSRHSAHLSGDQQVQDKIHKHLTDPNDKITEEDIKNINTDLPENLLETVKAEETPLTTQADESIEEKEKEADESTKINSTWNVLEDQ